MTNPLGASHCENCKAPTGNAICWRCTQLLRGMLHDMRPLIGELDIQVSKQNVEPRQPGSAGKKTEYPILFNVQASALMDRILETLAGLLREMAPGVLLAPMRSFSRASRAKMHLICLEENVIPLSRIEGAFHTVQELKARALQMIDRQPRRKALGVCKECQRGLFATDDQDEVECCGTKFDVAEHREKMNTLARDHWVTSEEAIRLGESEGVQFNASTIRSWVKRDKIQPRQPVFAGQKQRFRFGDLLDLARADDS